MQNRAGRFLCIHCTGYPPRAASIGRGRGLEAEVKHLPGKVDEHRDSKCVCVGGRGCSKRARRSHRGAFKSQVCTFPARPATGEAVRHVSS